MQPVTSRPELTLPLRSTVLEPPPEVCEAVERDLAAYNPEARKRELDERTLRQL